MTAERIKTEIDELREKLAAEFPAAASSAALDRVADAAKKAADSARPDPALAELPLQAEYAVGKGLITREELNDLRNTYGGQADLSMGLLPPFLLLVFALLVRIDNPKDYWVALPIVFLVSGFLAFMGAERRNKYRVEVRLLLLGRMQKQLEADQAAKETKKEAAKKDVPDAITKAVQDAIAKLKLEVKPLVVQVQSEPSASQQPGPASEAPTGAAKLGAPKAPDPKASPKAQTE